MSKLATILCGLFLLNGCGSGGGSGSVTGGEIFHDTAAAYSQQGEFEFTENTRTTIKLENCWYGGNISDCNVLDEQVRVGKQEFPIGFSFEESDLGSCLTEKGRKCRISVRVVRDGGESLRVGDLLNEYLITVDAVPSTINVTVTGIEDCDAKNAGGYCTSLQPTP